MVAADVREHLDDIVDAALARIADELPGLLAEPESRAFGRASSEALLRAFAAALEHDLPDGDHAPPEAVAYGRWLARRDVPLSDVLRSYRLGQEVCFARAVQLAATLPPAERADPIVRIGLRSFTFADAAMREVSATYEDERERRARRTVAHRDRVLRALAAGDPVDVTDAELVLGRRLDGPFRAVLVWADGGGEEVPALVRAVLGGSSPALLEESTGEVVAWLVGEDLGRARALVARGQQVAAGAVGHGAAGMARSLAQARLAARVATPGAPRLLTYEDHALVALLLGDAPSARRFAADELGGLAGPTHARIRETLAAYYEHGQDVTATAARTGVHRNTVARRLRRAGELLGTPLADRAAERAVALRLA